MKQLFPEIETPKLYSEEGILAKICHPSEEDRFPKLKDFHCESLPLYECTECSTSCTAYMSKIMCDKKHIGYTLTLKSIEAEPQYLNYKNSVPSIQFRFDENYHKYVRENIFEVEENIKKSKGEMTPRNLDVPLNRFMKKKTEIRKESFGADDTMSIRSNKSAFNMAIMPKLNYVKINLKEDDKGGSYLYEKISAFVKDRSTLDQGIVIYRFDESSKFIEVKDDPYSALIGLNESSNAAISAFEEDELSSKRKKRNGEIDNKSLSMMIYRMKIKTSDDILKVVQGASHPKSKSIGFSAILLYVLIHIILLSVLYYLNNKSVEELNATNSYISQTYSLISSILLSWNRLRELQLVMMDSPLSPYSIYWYTKENYTALLKEQLENCSKNIIEANNYISYKSDSYQNISFLFYLNEGTPQIKNVGFPTFASLVQ